ncbi:MAG: ABC transporter substrate-binding protein, partial [Chloroflexota bacterium]|nr:ABC transporter substrate-binding protein [Chloroflexota bacterium]
AAGTPAPATPTTTKSSPTSAAAGAAAVRPAQPTGELKLAIDGEFPATLDATRNGYQLVRLGIAETLTRLTPQMKLVPWLAREVTNVDPSTWRVSLRPNAKFWDGSPVTAQDVQNAFQANWAAYPAASGLLSKDTQIKVVDATTLEFKTPDPIGNLPNVISAQFFIVHKNGTTMTGPYRPTNIAVGQELNADAFVDHWDGPPPLAKLTVRLVTDANARVLALRSGDIDLVYGVPPQATRSLSGTDLTVTTVASGREDYLVVNHRRLPFSDQAVREATALAVDRTPLLAVGLAGQGAVATGMFPPDQGVENVAMQSSDAARAKQVLDTAGWTAGADGVRAKNGHRLSFQLLSAPARTEWTPMAVAIQAQLQAVGYEVQIEQVKNIGDQLAQNQDFDVAMYSANMLVTGDPLYIFNQTLATGGPANYGGYTNPQLEATLASMRAEADPSKRQALAAQAQESIKADFPNVYLLIVPFIAANSKKVKGYTLHPNDLYIVDNQISLAA